MSKKIRLLSFILILFVAGCVSSGLTQTTDTVLMVCPDDFAYNPQTAASNVFQHQDKSALQDNKLAMEQFNGMVDELSSADIRVIRMKSREDVKTPDAVFPNNWFSTHRDGKSDTLIVVYPMHTPNRRAEIRVGLLKEKLKQNGITVSRIIDLTHYSEQGKALEGTGSLVLDRVHKVAFASLSPRTDRQVLDDFCVELGYRPVGFHSHMRGKLIYHTNVMMSVGTDFAVICAESIKDDSERELVLKELRELGKRIILISAEQIKHMCGNILELHSRSGNKVILMSTSAYSNFTPQQKKELEKSASLLPVDIHTIENIGGGSARCMVAEIFHSEGEK
ncbi:MAG: amidinotransferase [Deltaproteobacteria bacterium]|nr:amidinotransferase [Deltaproteobacteria bacterium]